MTVVKVSYLGTVRGAAGVDVETYDLEDRISVQELVDRMLERHGEQLRREITEGSGSIRQDVILMMDGRKLDPAKDMGVVLGETGELQVMTFANMVIGG